jgi:hypothetical protein
MSIRLQASVPLGPLVAGQPLPDAKALLVAQPDGEMSVALEEKKVGRLVSAGAAVRVGTFPSHRRPSQHALHTVESGHIFLT